MNNIVFGNVLKYMVLSFSIFLFSYPQMKSLVFYSSFSQYSYVLHTPFVSFERKFLLKIAILVRCLKIFLNQNQNNFEKKFFNEISSPQIYIGIQIYKAKVLYFSLRLYTVSYFCCFVRVWTVSRLCQKLIQDSCIV